MNSSLILKKIGTMRATSEKINNPLTDSSCSSKDSKAFETQGLGIVEGFHIRNREPLTFQFIGFLHNPFGDGLAPLDEFLLQGEIALSRDGEPTAKKSRNGRAEPKKPKDSYL